MALTISSRKDVVVGDLRGVRCNVLFDSSYPTDGEAFTPGEIGLGEVTDLLVEAGPNSVGTAAQSGHSFKLGGTKSAPKIIAYATVGTEVGNGVSLATVQANFLILGH